jgi:large subunit ribosomal protein L25
MGKCSTFVLLSNALFGRKRMAEVFELNAKAREDLGKAAARRLRRTVDGIPAIVYGADKEPTTIILDHNKIAKALKNEAFYSSILTLKLDNEPVKVVVKAIQRHPSKPKILHMDFFRINLKEKLNMNIPLHVIGAEESPGLEQGGIASHLMSDVEVRCLPGDLPEFLEIDISKLDMDGVLHLSDIKCPKGVEIVALAHDHDSPVVSIHHPRVEVEETPAEAAPEGAEEAAEEQAASSTNPEEETNA